MWSAPRLRMPTQAMRTSSHGRHGPAANERAEVSASRDEPVLCKKPRRVMPAMGALLLVEGR